MVKNGKCSLNPLDLEGVPEVLASKIKTLEEDRDYDPTPGRVGSFDRNAEGFRTNQIPESQRMDNMKKICLLRRKAAYRLWCAKFLQAEHFLQRGEGGLNSLLR